MSPRSTFVGVALATLLTAPCLAQDGIPSTERVPVPLLERRIPELLKAAELPGLTIAVIEDEEVSWVGGYGVRNVLTGEPVRESTVFEAASLSKPVFAYGVLELVDRGLLELDRPLHDYLPYADVAADPRRERITARMVLSHTSGFPNWRGDGPLTIDFEPGDRFSYSGEGFVYLQKVVERLTGEPIASFLDREVLVPLGMERSSFVWRDAFAADVAVPHDQSGEPMDLRRREDPNVAFSLVTTAPDYARFLIALMRGEGWSDRVRRMLTTPQAEVDEGVAWGLGIGLQDDPRGRAVWHWGHNDGYRAFALAYPSRGDGIVWFANGDGMLVLEDLIESAFGEGHPALAWLGYEQHDDPERVARIELERVIRERGIEAGRARYDELRETRPSEVFGESMLNRLGYALLRSDRVDGAIAVFRWNVERYPEAFNPWDSLGEAYYVKGEYERALDAYRTSVELNPDNANGHRMIERVREAMTGAGPDAS